MPDFNNLVIDQGEKISIDGVEIKNIKHYELQHSAGEAAELTIKMEITVCRDSLESRQ